MASPALQRLVVLPQTEFFTEFWILGPNHNAEGYPSNITSSETYHVFMDVANHLGSAAYYSIQVKFRNQTQSEPDSLNRTSSTLPALYNINAIVADKENWELPITFSLTYTFDESVSQVSFRDINFDGATLDISSYQTSWDPIKEGFFGNIVFELWIYDDTTGNFRYHERSTDLKLNMKV